jgi:N-acyl-L-homoserine lactone synthetase
MFVGARLSRRKSLLASPQLPELIALRQCTKCFNDIVDSVAEPSMSVICVDWESAHLHGEAWISHHRLRHRIFVERQRWEVPTYNGLEYDQFDTPAARYLLWLDAHQQARGVTRLIPTTQPYMVQTLWPQLVDGSLPQLSTVWEATRFGCDRDLDAQTRRRVVAELICGCQEFGLANGVSKYLGVMPLAVFRHVIAAAGCRVTQLGPSHRMQHHQVAAAYIEVSTATLAAVRRQTGIHGPILARHFPLVA